MGLLYMLKWHERLVVANDHWWHLLKTNTAADCNVGDLRWPLPMACINYSCLYIFPFLFPILILYQHPFKFLSMMIDSLCSLLILIFFMIDLNLISCLYDFPFLFPILFLYQHLFKFLFMMIESLWSFIFDIDYIDFVYILSIHPCSKWNQQKYWRESNRWES